MRHKMRILIVDDEPVILRVLQGIFENEYIIDTANSGESALAKIHVFHPDLMILDAIMPEGISGLEVCRQIKTDQKTENIKVIMISAKATDLESREEGYGAGADDYVIKPFIHEDLVAKVQAWLRCIVNHEQLSQKVNDLEKETRVMWRKLQQLEFVNEEIKNGEIRFRSVIERITDGLVILKNMQLKYVNQALGTILGYPMEDLLKVPLTASFAPAALHWLEERSNIREHNKDIPAIFRTYLRHRDGNLLTVELNAEKVPFYDCWAELVVVKKVTVNDRENMALPGSSFSN